MPETKTKRRHPAAIEPRRVMLHGRSVTYAEAGSGSVLLLIHGMAGTYENWQAVMEPLARDHTVLALDLPGHGASAPGGGDYSLGALAARRPRTSSRCSSDSSRRPSRRTGTPSSGAPG